MNKSLNSLTVSGATHSLSLLFSTLAFLLEIWRVEKIFIRLYTVIVEEG